jgi:hypothetical protein
MDSPGLRLELSLSIPLNGFWMELVKVHPQLFKLSIPLNGFPL